MISSIPTNNPMFTLQKRYHRIIKIIGKIQNSNKHKNLLRKLEILSVRIKYVVNSSYGIYVTNPVTRLYREGESDYIRHIGKLLTTCDGNTLPLGIDQVDDLKEWRDKFCFNAFNARKPYYLKIPIGNSAPTTSDDKLSNYIACYSVDGVEIIPRYKKIKKNKG